eukprot:m.662527 g.662527  ORF g.662527 m.662527 type:complete len:376 (+) comp22741_c0_seq13:345-1472(+)
MNTRKPPDSLAEKRAACNEGRTNLLKACRSGDAQTAERMIAFLLARGGSSELACPLSVYSRDGSQQVLTPLKCAAAEGHLDIVHKIMQGMAPLDMGKKLVLEGVHGAVKAAISSGNCRVVSYLCKEFTEATKHLSADNSEHTSIYVDIFQHAVSSIVATRFTSDHGSGSVAGIEACLKELLQYNDFSDHIDELLFDSANFARSIDSAINSQNCARSVESTVNLFGGQAPRSHESMNALEIFCSYGHPQAARLLLEAGADPNGSSGGLPETPLHHAVRSWNRPLITLLLEAGADAVPVVSPGTTCKDRNGSAPKRSALDTACETNNALAVEWLVRSCHLDPDNVSTDCSNGSRVREIGVDDRDTCGHCGFVVHVHR